MSIRLDPRRSRVRRSQILLATSMCLAVLLTVGGSGSAAFGERSTNASRPSAIPTGFRAQSLSWVSPKHGWMLGSAPCGQATCTTVVGTTDGGGTWKKLGTLAAPLTLEKESGVTEIRFADDLDGWAFEPALYATTDGGATWQRQAPPGGGHLALALAGNSDGVYAVVSPCRLNRLCKSPATLWHTTPGQGSWTQVSLTLPALSGFGTVVLAVHGVVAYLAVPASLSDLGGSVDPDVLDVTVDGQEWSSRPDPCDPRNGETLTSVAPISDTKVALLCQGNIGFGKAEKRVLRSNDTGQTTRPAGTMPLYGIVTQLAAAPNGTLVAASFSIGSWIYRNAGGQSWTTQVDLGDGGMGWNDIVFTTNQVGFVIHGPASCCGGHGPGELWETEDGGVTWAPV
jgi:photosystem II stability/assembly factor-like uncharacterized protein